MIVEHCCTNLQIMEMGDAGTSEEATMEMMTHPRADREAQRMHANREELVERIARAIRADGTVQPLTGLHLNRVSVPLTPVYGVLEPSVAVIVQGSKEVLLGESRYRYSPSEYLLATIERPSVRRVLFGDPPMRDVQRLREAASAVPSR